MRSLTSRSPLASFLTFRGLSSFSSSSRLPLRDELRRLDAIAVAGISNHSSPPISTDFKKNGHSECSIWIDSCTSAAEIGTGEDLMMAGIASDTGSAFRLFAEGLAVIACAGEVKSIQILSAIPPSRPRRHLRRVSSWPSFKSSSFDMPAFDMRTLLGVEGGCDSERLRIRS